MSKKIIDGKLVISLSCPRKTKPRIQVVYDIQDSNNEPPVSTYMRCAFCLSKKAERLDSIVISAKKIFN